MLIKVMKYENKSVGRLLLPALGLSLAFSYVLRLVIIAVSALSAPAGGVAKSVVSVLCILLASGLLFLAQVVVVVRFYKSMLGHEGYLTHTLPVTTGVQLWGRTLVDLAYLLVSIVAALLCILLALPGISGLFRMLGQQPVYLAQVNNESAGVFTLGQMMERHAAGSIALGVLIFFIGLLFILVQLYACVAIGGAFGRNAFAYAIVAYFVLNTVEGIVAFIGIGIPIGIEMGRLGGWHGFNQTISAMSTPQVVDTAFHYMAALILIMALVFALITAANFAITHYCFKRRMNLE